jgi:pyruvate dehydrogenase E2 component (dihydrolipoamide acetyltransferase)
VMTYLTPSAPSTSLRSAQDGERESRAALVAASPKARRLAQERGVDIATLRGSGPGGAVVAADIPTHTPALPRSAGEGVSTVWRVMAERMTQSWTTVPHFYLVREVAASGLVELRGRIASIVQRRNGIRPTYTDLLVKIVAMALRDHPRVNASWTDGTIHCNDGINVGLASAIEEGLIVPVIHGADALSIGEIAARRKDIVERAGAGKLRPADISGGTFTLTNLGMYNVDAFNAIINTPQAAILAVGRIAERVVPVDGQPAVRPMLTLTLACDHRVVDGARSAQFLDDLANLIEEPWGILA